jgi:hypothetical protein
MHHGGGQRRGWRAAGWRWLPTADAELRLQVKNMTGENRLSDGAAVEGGQIQGGTPIGGDGIQGSRVQPPRLPC